MKDKNESQKKKKIQGFPNYEKEFYNKQHNKKKISTTNKKK